MPSPSTGRPATTPARRRRSTASAGYTLAWATTARPLRSASRPSRCCSNPVIRKARQKPGTALATPTHNLGSYRQAIGAYQTALRLIRATRDKGAEALILRHLGDTLLATASYDAA